MGHVDTTDRTQRMVIGGALMLLTLGSMEQFTWRLFATLIIQADLLLTGIFGWCPIYWTCRRIKGD